jgi:hypothetical protein
MHLESPRRFLCEIRGAHRKRRELVLHSTACAPFLFLILVGACRTSHAPPTFNYAADLGVAVKKADRTCLDIRNRTLSAGQRIWFVTASAPQTTGEAEITGKADQPCTAADKNKPGFQQYEFSVVRGSLQTGVPVFALTNFTGTLTTTETGVTGDLDGDGIPEFFRSCTSSEGVHLTVWTGKPLEGQRKWHYYYYLGYDVDANCTEGDTKLDTP